MLETVRVLAQRVVEGLGSDVPTLRRRGLDLLTRLGEHLELEDRLLVPAVRQRGSFGAAQASWLQREHTEQRLLLEYIVSRLRDETRPTLVLGRELESLAEVLLEDMDHEERAVLERLS